MKRVSLEWAKSIQAQWRIYWVLHSWPPQEAKQTEQNDAVLKWSSASCMYFFLQILYKSCTFKSYISCNSITLFLCLCSSALSWDSGWVWDGWEKDERMPAWCLHHFLISLWPTCFWKSWSWRNHIALSTKMGLSKCRQHFLLHSGSLLDLFLPSQCRGSQELQIDKTKLEA